MRFAVLFYLLRMRLSVFGGDLALFLRKYGWCCGGLWKFLCDVQGCFALLSEHNDPSLLALLLIIWSILGFWLCLYTCPLHFSRRNAKINRNLDTWKSRACTYSALCPPWPFLPSVLFSVLSQQKYAVNSPKMNVWHVVLSDLHAHFN